MVNVVRTPLPSFTSGTYDSEQMRQFASALELRFQSLEIEERSLFDTGIFEDYALADHSHDEPPIVDLVLVSNVTTLTYIKDTAFALDLSAATGSVTITLAGGPPTGKYGRIAFKVTQGTTPQTVSFAGVTTLWETGFTFTATADAVDIFTFQMWGSSPWYGSVRNDFT